MKPLCVAVMWIVLISGLVSCDESGSFEYEHLGKWQKTGDSLITSTQKSYTPQNPNSIVWLEFFEDLRYESLELNIIGDTTYHYVGSWSLALATLSLEQEFGYQRTHELSVQEDEMSLSQIGWYQRSVQIYHKIE